MKIEIGESLIYSWLRHVKLCQIVQNNWKVSPKWKDTSSVTDIQKLIEMCNEEFKEFFEEQFDQKECYILKKNNFEQFIMQAEADSVGININSNKNEYYVVDVAFHSLGLNYGSKYVTSLKVIEKCLRSAMCLYKFFGTKSGEIYFVSPLINPATLNIIVPSIKKLNSFFKEQGYSFHFILIEGRSFESEILNPLLNIGSDISDTNELFMRAMLLMELFGYGSSNSKDENTKSNEKSEMHGPTVGYLAKIELRNIIENLPSSSPILLQLQDKNYCKNTFGISFPVLVKTDSEYDGQRYYSVDLKVGNDSFKLTNYWFEKHKTKLSTWIDNMSKNITD